MALSLSQLIDRGETPITKSDVARFRAAGHWQARTIRSVLRAAAAEHPDRHALVGNRSGGTVLQQKSRQA
jgi:cyclohexanecarboxylate-CoA ligase